MILVTGATGFVGNALTEYLCQHGYEVGTLGRQQVGSLPFIHCDLTQGGDLHESLRGVSSIVHCAGRAHVMHETAQNPLDAFRAVNTTGTVQLAEQAAEAGVRHFIFISSIKVNGETTEGRPPFSVFDKVEPNDPYGLSKWEAEQELAALSRKTDMQITCLRPPLIYGPGVGANFEKLYQLACSNVPLPLVGVKNKRSMIALSNLVDVIVACITNQKAYGETFLVSDDDDVSTPELIRRIQSVEGKKSNLLYVPSVILKLLGTLTKRSDQVSRLCGSLQVDITHAKQTLNWVPPVTMSQELERIRDNKHN